MNNITAPAFYIGVVEDRNDPLMLGRVRVRVMGLHTHDKTLLPTQDLPWAYKIQPTTSGAMSGIGHAPVGVMEGTWVAVQYIDPDKQMPFIVGTLGGIPPSKHTPLESFELDNGEDRVILRDSEGKPVTDSSGKPVTTGEPTETPPPSTTEPAKITDAAWKEKCKANLGKLESNGNYGAVNSIGYLGKYQFGTQALIDMGYVKKGTPVVKGHAALNDPSVWTGKDGCISKQAFLSNSTAQESAMDGLMQQNYKTLQRIGVPVDTMDDATKSGMLSAAHLVGAGGAKSYYNGVNKSDAYGSTADKYFKSGYKAVAGSQPAVGSQPKAEEAKAPAAPPPVGKQVRDADPAAAGSNLRYGYNKKLQEFESPSVGFQDPNAKYPLKTHRDEPDTNRLARHQKIAQTIVQQKELDRHTGVEKANGKGTWDQSPVPYNAKYPYNNVWQSESGHVMEFDDTADRERVHLYHRMGTFIEWDHNGTQVNRIVGDGFEIIERNGYVHVVGNLDVAVDGAKTLRVQNTLDVEVHGSTTINLHDNANLNVAGNFDLSVGGNFNIHAGGTLYMHSGEHFAVDAPRIDLNSGVADSLSTISSIGGKSSDSSALPVRVRGEEIGMLYEFAEDDPPSVLEAYKEKMINEGVATKEELEEKPEVVEEKTPEPNNVTPPEFVCGIPSDKTEFTGAEQLSKHFTLADLTNGYSRKLTPQNGKTPAELYCNLKSLATNILDPIKDKYPNMRVNSAFRRAGDAPGSSPNSQHNTGQAADLSFSGVSRAQLYDVALEIQKLVPYDQLILEYSSSGGNGWIHISEGKGRGQHFTMVNNARVSKDLYTISKVYS